MTRTLLVTGGSGYLGSALTAYAGDRGWQVVGTSYTRPGRRLDIADRAQVCDLVEQIRPRLVIHTAYVQAGPQAWTVNVEGSRNVAAAAHAAGARLVHVSSDVVFDGRLGRPYREQDEMRPLTEYGKTKAGAESAVRGEWPDAVIVRTSLIYGGPGARQGAQEKLAADPGVEYYSDEMRSPVQIDDLAAALLELGELDASGPIHVGGADGMSRAQFAALLSGRDVRSRPAPLGRPLDCRLDSTYARGLLSTRLRGAREVLAASSGRGRTGV